MNCKWNILYHHHHVCNGYTREDQVNWVAAHILVSENYDINHVEESAENTKRNSKETMSGFIDGLKM